MKLFCQLWIVVSINVDKQIYLSLSWVIMRNKNIACTSKALYCVTYAFGVILKHNCADIFQPCCVVIQIARDMRSHAHVQTVIFCLQSVVFRNKFHHGKVER